ncbi:hypothetical protein ACIXUL_17985, partial [Bacteroides fragilis]
VKSSNRKRKNKRGKRIENEGNREKGGIFWEKGISAGPKGIVVIKASMGAGNFKKQGWEWKREELTIKTHRTLLKN